MKRGSIRRKVMRVTAAAAVVSVVLTGAAIVLYDVVDFRRAVVAEHATLARLVARHSAAALVFDDPDFANKLLQGLDVDSHVVEAVLESSDGRVFARYRRAVAPPAHLPGILTRMIDPRLETLRLTLDYPVQRDGVKLGGLHLTVSLEEIEARVASYLWVVLGVLLTCALFALPLSSRLQRVLTDPLLGLVAAAGRIGKGDLTTRVGTGYDDELGTLAGAFNEMTEKLSATTVSKDYLDDILESMNDALFVVDPRGRMERVNETVLELLEYEEGDLLGEPVSRVLAEADALLDAARRQGPIEDREASLLGRDGRALPVSLSIALMGEPKAPVRSFVLVARDIRERKAQERALIEAREAALEASRLKSQFLANVSHEIRTPMNGIIGMTELALLTKLSPEQRHQLETVRASADALLRLIDDVLDLSVLEAGRLELESTGFSPSDCVTEAIAGLALEAERKGVELVVDLAPESPKRAVGDPARLRQVLTRLLSNAVKFTDRGEVVVRVQAYGAGHSRARFLFAVSDTGIGIPSDKREEIFDIFAQVDGSTTRRFGGAGLGLAIASRLVRAMGGGLYLESEPGRGSTFYFELALEVPPQSSEASDEVPMELEELSALVVDDCATSREVIEKLLLRWGAAVRGASDPRAAEALVGVSRFDVAVVDADLGGKNGAELARRLAAGGARAVLLLTPSGRAQAVASPASLQKPVTPEALLGALRRLLSPSQAVSADESAAPSSSRRVLIVEDNPVNRAVVEQALRKRGHEVTSVENGRLAVERVREERYDVVIMDIQMPEMDGIEATRAIRDFERQTGRHPVPIVALTAHAMEGDRERGLRAGMDDYLSKPVKPHALFDAVERLSQGNRTKEGPPPEGARATVLDVDSLLERIGHDETLFTEVIRLYFEETPQLMDNLREGLAEGTAGEARRAAHRLRGMLATMSADAAAGAAERLENHLTSGRLEGVEGLVETLKMELGELELVLSDRETNFKSTTTRVIV